MGCVASIDDQVKTFVAAAVAKSPNEIHPSATLLGDLGIDGDDADEFLSDFAKHFRVDMAGFVFADHFGTEGIYPWQIPRFVWNLIGELIGRDPHETAGLKAVRVEDLIRAAKAKKWESSSDVH